METLALSARAGMLKPSPTLSITAKANALKAAGEDVVGFAAGEPDFDTPEPVVEAAVAALHAGFTKYTPSAGIGPLKEAIARKLLRENGVKVGPDQVVVGCGAKQSLYEAFQVLLDPGDEVILIAPYWMTYAEQVRLAGGVPKVVRTRAEDGFVPDYDSLKAAVGPRTKAIVVNSPSNPSGALLPRATLKEVAALALSRGLWIVTDEIYERLVYGGETQTSVAALGAEVAERTVTIGGCSKSYAMTGWRIGFAAAPLPIAKAMGNLQDQITSNPTSFAQKGAVAAFDLPAEAVETMRREFEARRDLIVGLLRAIPGVTLTPPQGAFYALPDFSGYMGGDDAALAAHLLEAAKVAVIPGSVFEAPGHLRLSYACSRADIERGVARLAEAVSKLG